MNPDEQSLYAEMRAAIRGDRERAEKRAHEKRGDPPSSPPPETETETADHRRFAGLRRLFGGQRDR